MLAVIGLPGQLFADGVIVNVTVTGAVVAFVNVPAIEEPDPLLPIPVMPGLSLVQL